MLTPNEARKYIENTRMPYGHDVILPDVIDTSNCQNFFGIRCDGNVHVKGTMKAHIDRVDPRYDPIGHLMKDVGINFTIKGSVFGAVLGSLIASDDRAKGAIIGAIIGGIVGMSIDSMG